MKKILSLICAVAMLLSLATVFASAEVPANAPIVIGYQLSALNGKTRNVRFIAKGTDTAFQNVGFRITVEGDSTHTWDVHTDVVFQSINATDANGVTYEATTAEAENAAYLYMVTITNVPAVNDVTFHVTPYATNADSTEVVGETKDATVEQYCTLITPTTTASTAKQSGGNIIDAFTDNATVYTTKQASAGNPNWIEAGLAQKSRIWKIEVKNWQGRMSGTKVMGSLDGKTWETLATLNQNTSIYEVSSTKGYNMIRLEQNSSSSYATAYWTVSTVLLYGEAAPDTDTVRANVTSVSYSTNLQSGTAMDWSKIWEENNTVRNNCQQANAISIIGQFAEPTVISKVVYKQDYYSSRNNCTLYASTDGENWVVIREMPTLKTSANLDCIREFDVEDTTAYTYVKLEHPAFASATWSGGLYWMEFRTAKTAD